MELFYKYVCSNCAHCIGNSDGSLIYQCRVEYRVGSTRGYVLRHGPMIVVVMEFVNINVASNERVEFDAEQRSELMTAAK